MFLIMVSDDLLQYNHNTVVEILKLDGGGSVRTTNKRAQTVRREKLHQMWLDIDNEPNLNEERLLHHLRKLGSNTVGGLVVVSNLK